MDKKFILTPNFVKEKVTKGILLGVIRNLYCDVSEELLMKEFNNSCERINGSREKEEDFFLSLREGIRVLTNLHIISLNLQDIMAIMLQCEPLIEPYCQSSFSSSSSSSSSLSLKISSQKLCQVVISYYESIRTCSSYQTLVDFQNHRNVDDDILMQGLTKYHLEEDLTSACKEDFLPAFSFSKLLTSIPNVNIFSSFDYQILLSFCEINENNEVNIRNFIPHAYSLLYCLKMLRYRFYRLPLFGLQTQLSKPYVKSSDRFKAPLLLQLAEKAISSVEIKTRKRKIKLGNDSIEEELSIHLPFDSIASTPPSSLPSSPLASPSRGNRTLKIRNSFLPPGRKKVILLSDSPKYLQVFGYYVKNDGSKDTFITAIISVEISQLGGFGDKNTVILSVNEYSPPFIGLEASSIASFNLPIPSLAQMDEILAEEFALNAVNTEDAFCVEVRHNCASLCLAPSG